MELVAVYRTTNQWRAGFIKSLLDSEEVESFLAGIDPFASPSPEPKEIQVMVRTEDAERAREVLVEAQFDQKPGQVD